jgi:hypothetical protein
MAMSQEGSHHSEVTLWFPMHLLSYVLVPTTPLLFSFILLTTIAVTLDLFPFSLACYHFVTITYGENICYEWTSLSKYSFAFTFPRSVPSSWNIDAYYSATHSLQMSTLLPLFRARKTYTKKTLLSNLLPLFWAHKN